MTQNSKICISLVFALALGGCKGQVAVSSGSEVKADPPAEEPAEAEEAEEPEEAEVVEEADKDVSLEDGEIKIKKKIRFATGSAEILEESNDLVKAIAKAIKKNKVKKVEVIGHTDTVGDDKANQKLSEDRAKSVVEALKARKVKAELIAIGMGESKTMCSEETEECHTLNRRVQFKVIE